MLSISSFEQKDTGTTTKYHTSIGDNQDFKSFLEFIKLNVIKIALDALVEEQAKGFDKKPVVVVDGKRSDDIRSVANVKPLGQIMFVTRADFSKVVLDTYATILRYSPIDSGHYRKYNYVFFNGKQIATTHGELETWFKVQKPVLAEKDRIRFVNITPYARRLEFLGVAHGRVTSALMRTTRDARLRKRFGKDAPKVRRENGAYFLGYKLAKTKYGKNLLMRFEALPGDYLGITSSLPAAGGRTFGHSFHPKSKYNAGFYLYPTIVFSASLIGLNQ